MNLQSPTAHLRFALARRIAVSTFCALLIVLIASRINRPVPLEILNGQPRLTDEILPEVRLKTLPLKSAIESIRKVAKAKVTIDHQSLPEYEQLANADPPDWPEMHLRNVRLGLVLSLVLNEIRSNSTPEFHEEGGEIVIGGSGSSSLPVFVRMYDVRDMARAGSQDDPPRSVSPLTYGQTTAIENLFIETSHSSTWYDHWSLHVFAGRLIVAANASTHREIEQLLLMLRAGDTLSPSEGKAKP